MCRVYVLVSTVKVVKLAIHIWCILLKSLVSLGHPLVLRGRKSTTGLKATFICNLLGTSSILIQQVARLRQALRADLRTYSQNTSASHAHPYFWHHSQYCDTQLRCQTLRSRLTYTWQDMLSLNRNACGIKERRPEICLEIKNVKYLCLRTYVCIHMYIRRLARQSWYGISEGSISNESHSSAEPSAWNCGRLRRPILDY